ELHHQDAVLRRQANQHHQPDLAIDIVDEAASPLREERANDRDRYREQDDERQREALVLAGERQIAQQQREAEDRRRLAPGPDLLQRDARPRIREALRQDALRQVVHLLQRLAGAEAWRGGAVDRRRAEQVEVA